MMSSYCGISKLNSTNFAISESNGKCFKKSSRNQIEQKTQDRNEYYQHRRPQPYFGIGTKVFTTHDNVTTHALSQASKGLSAKFFPKRDRPYAIISKIGSSLYEITAPDNFNVLLGTHHASDLTVYKQSDDLSYTVRKRGRLK